MKIQHLIKLLLFTGLLVSLLTFCGCGEELPEYNTDYEAVLYIGETAYIFRYDGIMQDLDGNPVLQITYPYIEELEIIQNEAGETAFPPVVPYVIKDGAMYGNSESIQVGKNVMQTYSTSGISAAADCEYIAVCPFGGEEGDEWIFFDPVSRKVIPGLTMG